MINWKLLRQHAQNYDGTCRYCGGLCANEEARILRLKIRLSLVETKNEAYNCTDKEKREKLKRKANYLNKQYEETLTWR